MHRSNRYQKVDHISHIQASLKEMKNEVDEYLKKSSNQYQIPQIKLNQYLNMTRIHNLNRSFNQTSRDNIKMIKDLSAQKLHNSNDCQAIKEILDEKREKNKVIKLKRVAHHNKNTSTVGEVDCLLPNICQIKLDVFDKNEKVDPYKNLLQNRTLQTNFNSIDEALMKEKQFHSIDMNRQSDLQWVQSKHFNALRVTNKWLSSSKSRQLIDTIHKKNSWSGEGIESPKNIQSNKPKTLKNINNLLKTAIKDNEMPSIDPKVIVSQHRKQSILKRKQNNSIKDVSSDVNQSKRPPKRELFIKRHQKQKQNRFRFDYTRKGIKKMLQQTKNQYSPWWQGDITTHQKSLSLLQEQYF